MEFLHSNLPPVRFGGKTFTDVFYDLLSDTVALDIAVGYITADSLATLEQLVELNNLPKLNLTIGMHYFDKFTKIQYNAALHLNDYLKGHNKGEVRLVTSFKYHGKLYSFSKDETPIAGIIGSNNLGSIIEDNKRIYDSAFLVDDMDSAIKMKSFIDKLVDNATENIADVDIQDFNKRNTLLDDQDGVESVDSDKLLKIKLTETKFEIPLKGAEIAPKSNLNVFFGAGRKQQNGIIRPRPWYEVEIIVPRQITSQKGYPVSDTDEARFKVVTDDGWSFDCNVSGNSSKNFRSDGGLTILGKWLKGRLEHEGALVVGQPITNETLGKYGRNTLTLTKTTTPNLWYLDFGVHKE